MSFGAIYAIYFVKYWFTISKFCIFLSWVLLWRQNRFWLIQLASRNVCHCFPHSLTSLSDTLASPTVLLICQSRAPFPHIQFTWCRTCCRINQCGVGINIYPKSADSCVFLAWGITSHPQCHSLWGDGRIYKQEPHIHRVLNLLGASQMQIQCCRYIIRGPGLTN